MADRPSDLCSMDSKKKDGAKKGEKRSSSFSKKDTELLKRGEIPKDDRRIEDAPENAYFNFYVLLTGFYNPDFPVELIKLNVPLHLILCIDTSNSGVNQYMIFSDEEQGSSSSVEVRKSSVSEGKPVSTSYNKFQILDLGKKDDKDDKIRSFWKVFLVKLWSPDESFYFRDTMCQIYAPRKLQCKKKERQEFIYKQISYVMYYLSIYKDQLNNYLDHIYVWNVEKDPSEPPVPGLTWPENLSNECISVPVILKCIVDAICGDRWVYQQSLSSDSIDSSETELESLENYFFQLGSCSMVSSWTTELQERGDSDLLHLYYKIKELDVKYNLVHKNSFHSDNALPEPNHSQGMCNFQLPKCGENLREMLLFSEGVFRSYWKKYNVNVNKVFNLEYCLLPYLMSKVTCSFQVKGEASETKLDHSLKENSSFELIEELDTEMCKPHFTVTEGSRNILRSVPFNQMNISRDFFCPEQLKVVSLEKVKATSAPAFRLNPVYNVEPLYMSEIFGAEPSKNPFVNLKGFVDESLFSQTIDFDFLEVLSKPKLLKKESEYWSNYNCIDHTYCALNDCIFLMLHNRMNADNIYHEAFNDTLRTVVGLRDFYDYVLEDEAQWVAQHDKASGRKILLSSQVLKSESYRDLTESSFWCVDSLKYNNSARDVKEKSTDINDIKIKTKFSYNDKLDRGIIHVETNMESHDFEGYNASDMAVQFSGIKTIYYSKNCSTIVQLVERLYGNQDLGVHITASSHTLHLYSYVCPEPHLFEPYTFHVTFKNEVVIAFGRRLLETYEEVEERIESKTMIKTKKNSSEPPAAIVKKQVTKLIEDEEFGYDMVVSLPNGLWIRTVRRLVKPCYIKQSFLADGEENTGTGENSRLFLPNGSLVRMMNKGTVEILRANASIVRANLSDLHNETDGENWDFSRYEVITGEGQVYVFEHGKKTPSKRFKVLKNWDMETNQSFFRREDGANYVLKNGTFCVEFKDGTKMSSSPLVINDDINVSSKSESSEESEEEESILGETETEEEFVLVHMEIIAEHPDYATVMYNSLTEEWKILLPQDSTITIQSAGEYSVDIDNKTEVKVEADLIQMNTFSSNQEPECTFKADLSVFKNKKDTIYCQMKDISGKVFVVEKNSNCYLLKEDEHSEGLCNLKGESSVENPSQENKSRVGSANLQNSSWITTDHNYNRMDRKNKYFLLRRDVTGLEALHIDDIKELLIERKKESFVLTQNIPGTESRCFILVTPVAKPKTKKWEVASILPSPKYDPDAYKKTTSSTYGIPPSWMHPFPKKRYTFVMPQLLTCRVFVETRRTELNLNIGTLDCGFYDMEDFDETKPPEIPPDGVEDYLKKLSEDDQNLLTEIYHSLVSSVLNEKRKLKPINSEKLEQYLKMSRYLVMMREYHKKCIRYHTVPNYFHHPKGMSWLIINELLLKFPDEGPLTRSEVDEDSSGSQEEIEYNLSLSAGQSFSSLSYRSDVSAETAPAVLRTGGVCKCKVRPARDVVSCPTVKFKVETNIEDLTMKSETGICEFKENEIEMEEQKGSQPLENLSLEDLMNLCLI